MNEKQTQDLFDKLYRKMSLTANTRFNSARRFKWHKFCASHLIAILSLILILTTLMQLYKVGENINSNYVPLIQLISSILILVFSLLVDKNDYGKLSDSMYSCASRINDLTTEMAPKRTNFNVFEYDDLSKKYMTILQQYEFIGLSSFQTDYKLAILKKPNYENTKFGGWECTRIWIAIVFSYICSFSIYIILTFLYIYFLKWLVWG